MGYGVAMPQRSSRHMSAEDRETLSLGLAHGHSLRTMARMLGRAPAHSWIPGCGRMCGSIWRRATRPNRLPDVSNVRILTTCGNTSRPKPSMWACLCCHAESCGAHCWRRSVRRARPADLGRGGPIDAADPPHDADGCASCRDRDPGGARPLGRRPDQGRAQWLGGRHPGGAHHTPGSLGSDGGDGCTECLRCGAKP